MNSWFDFQNYLRSFVIKNPTQVMNPILNTISWLCIFIATYAIYQHYINWNFDDSYIVFRMVDNLLNGNGWAYNQSEAYNASTSVLNTVLITLAAKLGHLSVPYAAHFVGAAGVLIAGSSLYLLLRERLAVGCSLAIALFIMFSMGGNLTWGLETHLFCGGVLLFCYLEGKSCNSWWLVGVLILLRPDAILILLLKLAFDLTFRKVSFSGLIVFSLILMPWIIFSVFNFGQIFPDTLSNKVWQGKSGFWGTGPIYLKGLLIYFWQNKIFLFLSPLILLGLYKTIKHYTALLFLFMFVGAQQAAYVILNVPTYHWYLTLPKLSLTLLALIGFAEAILYFQSRFIILSNLDKKEFNLSQGLIFGSVLIVFLNLTYAKETPDGRDVSYAKLSDQINSANIPSGAIAALEVGTIGYKVNRPILDLVSLTSKNPEFLTGKNNDLFFRLSPQIVVVHHPVWPMERAIFEDIRFSSLYSLGGIIADTAVPTKYYVLNKLPDSERERIISTANTRTFQKPSNADTEISSTVNANLRCNIDVFAYSPVDYIKVSQITKREKSQINLDGWIFSSDKNAPLSEVFVLVISSSGQTFVTKARAYERPDVAKAFSISSVITSGFKAEIDIADLPEGEYRLSIADKITEKNFNTCEKSVKFSLKE